MSIFRLTVWARAWVFVASMWAAGFAEAQWLEETWPGSFYFVVDKSKFELTARSFDDSRVVGRFRAITGKNLGDKVAEGDKKTPEGIYFLERRIPKTQLQALHGADAFSLNYPNPVDRIRKQGGYGIWIHGVDSESRMNNGYDTLGCVALSNKDIVDVVERIQARETPIVIVANEKAGESITILGASDPLVKRIHEWVEAWSSKDVDRYLGFYSDDFVGRKMDLPSWRRYKSRLTRSYQWIKVEIEDLKVLRHGKYAVAFFRQKYESDRYRNTTRKRLYLIEPATGSAAVPTLAVSKSGMISEASANTSVDVGSGAPATNAVSTVLGSQALIIAEEPF